MKENKFRGWDTAKNKMYSPEELEEDQLTLTVTGKFINVDSNRKENSEIYEHILPLQFTGLYDRNGKEIYEGDLVKYRRLGTGEYVNTAVTFSDAAFYADYILSDLMIYSISEIEVIGNIYETPITS